MIRVGAGKSYVTQKQTKLKKQMPALQFFNTTTFTISVSNV